MKKKKILSLFFACCLTASILSHAAIAEEDGISYADSTYDSYDNESTSEESETNQSTESNDMYGTDNEDSSDSTYSDSYSDDSDSDSSEDEYYLGTPEIKDNSQRQSTSEKENIDVLSTEDVNYEIGITTNSIPGWPQGENISSTSGIVMEDSTGTILYAKSMNAPIQPASTVKFMTLLLALENGNLSDSVVVTATGVSGIIDGGPNVQIQEGEVFTLEQCLYAMMVSSANDMALQVAEQIGGSVENFVQMMNDRAKALGCQNTVFTNPTGSPDPNMHSTAYDMALIVQAGIKNEDFRHISTALSYNIPPTNLSGGERVLTSELSLINPASELYYDGLIAGKGGYTESSASTLACAATRNDCTLICTSYAGTAETYESEAVSLLNYGYNNFSFLDVAAGDFSVISGGQLFVPAGTSPDQLASTDKLLDDGTLLRTYTFNGATVGTAIADLSSDGDTGIDTSGTIHMKEAREYTENKSMIPYGVIGGVGFILIVLLFVGIVKLAKRR